MVLSRLQPFEWIVASRFLREGRMQSLFIMLGVAIGVAVIVFMSALMQGLQANLVRRVLTAQPHIQVLPPRSRCVSSMCKTVHCTLIASRHLCSGSNPLTSGHR